MLIGAVLLAISACKYEDGSREPGQTCGNAADCVDGLECTAWYCTYPDGSREMGESCVFDGDCKEASDGQIVNCLYDGEADEDVCQVIGAEDWEYILCNDGTKSPTCTECSSGCCSGHGGCE